MTSVAKDAAVATPMPPVEAMRARAVNLGVAALPFATPLLTLVVIAASVRSVDPDRVGGLGLVTVIPPPVLVAAAALSVSFALVLSTVEHRAGRAVQLALVAHVAALLVVLHGLGSMLEAEPRFTTAWLHAGFVEVFSRHGEPLPGVDARFSWPGFFAGSASFVGAAGLPSALPLLRFAPLVFELAYLPPVALIARACAPSTVGRWAVIWLFLLTNWVGQDYFAPQAFAYLIFLSILALALVTLRPARPGRQVRVRWPLTRRRVVLSLAPEGPAAPRSVQAGVLVTALAAFTALAMSHQLTPVVLTVDVAALVLIGRGTVPLLPLAFAAVLVAWISYGATDFWMGHLRDLLGGGSVSASLEANINGRVQGSSAHLVVVGVRLLFGVVLWAAAAAGAWRALRNRRGLPVTAAVLAIAPFPVVALQPYGGEAQLRLYLFTLPFMLCLVARLFVPGDAPTRRAVAALAATGVLLVPAFYVARFGNEQFEQVRPGEVQAVAQTYRIAPAGASLVALDANVPWRAEHFADYDYVVSEAGSWPASVEALVARMPSNSRGSYLLVTRGQLAYAIVNNGAPTDVGTRLEGMLRATPRFQLVFRNADAALYRFVPGNGR